MTTALDASRPSTSGARFVEAWLALVLAAYADGTVLATLVLRALMKWPRLAPNEAVLSVPAVFVFFLAAFPVAAFVARPVLRRLDVSGLSALGGIGRAGLVVLSAWIHEPFTALAAAAVIGGASGCSLAARAEHRARTGGARNPIRPGVEKIVVPGMVVLLLLVALTFAGGTGERIALTTAVAAHLAAAVLTAGAGSAPITSRPRKPKA